MFNNMRKLMSAKNITVDAMAKLLGVSANTVQNKLNGKTEFTFGEAELIMEVVFPEYNYKYVFRRETDVA